MQDILSLAADNLLSPMILCFALGLFAALARSELTVPEAAAKALSIYLLFAIGFKGGVAVADHGVDASLISALIGGIVLSFALPFVAYSMLRTLTRLSVTDAAATAAHYGSISIVTFVTTTSVLSSRGIVAEGYMVAVAAAMEAPAIISALWLVSRAAPGGQGNRMDAELWREILLNGSIVLLVGSFVIGFVTGNDGMARIESFIVSPFQGVLCLFLLDMGLVAGRGLRSSRGGLVNGCGWLWNADAGGRGGLRACHGFDTWSVGWGCGTADDAVGFRQLYRSSGRHARGLARGKPVSLPDAVFGDYLSL